MIRGAYLSLRLQYIRLFVSMTLLMCFTMGIAQDKVAGIIVELSSGQQLEYRLTDNPKFSFDGNTVVLTADNVRLEYNLAEIAKVMPGKVQNVGSGIEYEKNSENNINIESGFIRLRGFTSGETIRIFTVGGSLVDTFYVDPNGEFVITMPTLPSGISIIKIRNQFIKVSK